MRLLLIVAVLGLVTACRPPESATANSTGEVSSDGVTVEMAIEGERTVGPAPVRVTVEENGKGVSGATVEIIGEMTHTGMAPVVARAEQVEPGVYLAEEFTFDMAGDWIVSTEVSLENGERLRAARALSVEQP